MSTLLPIMELRQTPERSNHHVTLIRPAIISSSGTWSAPIVTPVGLAYLAAFLRENGNRVSVVEGIAEGIDQFIADDGYIYQGLTIAQTVDRIPPDTDVVGITCMFSQDWLWVRRLLTAIRQQFPNILIVAGGEHTTAVPEFSLDDCAALDVCVLGEGEETLVDLVNHLHHPDGLGQVAGIVYRDGENIVRTAPRKRIREVDTLPRPAWDLFPMEVYFNSRNAHGVYRGRSIGILATRGCPYKCTFCSNPVMYGNAWVPRDPTDVLDEIEDYINRYQVTNIDFCDLTFVLRRKWIIDFCQKIEERGIKFTWQLPSGTRSEVIDQEVSEALYRAGCRNFTFAPESGSPETLKVIKKQVELDRLTAATKTALRAGIVINMNFIVGFPHETRRHIFQTIWFIWRMAAIGVHSAGVYMFSPYPGTELFKSLLADGTIKELNVDYFRSLVTFMDPFATRTFNKHISGRELAWWRFFAMSSFFALAYTFRPWRLWSLVRNLIRNESETLFEERLGALIRRPTAIQFKDGKQAGSQAALVS